MGFIYKITNNINGKCYIGKTERNIQIRWKEHLKNRKALTHLPLYKAFNKYGIENFTIEEIEQCSNEELDNREIYWINFFNSYKARKGYNCTSGGEGGIKTYEEDIDLIIQRYLKGERLDLLCKEFHHDYSCLRPKLIERGVIINTQAGPDKISKKVKCIDPVTKQTIKIYPSISAAARDISIKEQYALTTIMAHIRKQAGTNNICHNFLWEIINENTV